jgi:large subunit ribosomal protein L4
MKVSVYNVKSEKISDLTLDPVFFESNASPKLIQLAIRVYLANQRKSHASAKERSEVSGTTKKMWAQKGTGRARHGSDKAPQFVGGGKAHGPSSDRDYSLTLNKKMRTAALKAILTKIAQNKTIIVVDDLSKIEPKTKIAWDFMDKLEKQEDLLAKSRKIGIITSVPSGNIKRAFGNIPGFSVMNLSSLNVYNLSNQNFLVFTKKAITNLTAKK